MSTIVHLALDFFFHKWDDPQKRLLWLGVQPYIECGPDDDNKLSQWVANSIVNGQDTEYRLMDIRTDMDPRYLVPVSLPGNINYSVTFASASGPFQTLQSDRLGNNLIKNEAAFRDLNGFQKPGTAAQIMPNVISGAPYVSFFSDSLRQMALSTDARASDALMAQWLAQKLEMGQRIKFTTDIFEIHQPFFDATPVDESDVNTSHTNQQFLLGQLIPIPFENNELASIESIDFRIVGQPNNLMDAVKDGQAAIKQFFSTIPQINAYPGAKTMQWHTGFAKRVNAISRADNFKALPLHVWREDKKPGDPTLYELPFLWRLRRGQSGSETAKEKNERTVTGSNPPLQVEWSQLKRMVMRLSAPFSEDASVQQPSDDRGLDYSPYPKQITLEPVVCFEVELSLFRNTPDKIDKNSSGNKPIPPDVTLLQIKPTAEDERRFREFLENTNNHQWLNFSDKQKDNRDGVDLLFNPHKQDKKDELAENKVLPSAINLGWLHTFQFSWEQQTDKSYPWQLLAGVTLKNAFKSGYSPDTSDDITRLTGNATLMIKLQAANPITIQLEGYDEQQPGGIAQDSVFGPRWEQWRDAFPDENLPSFNGFLCAQLSELAEPPKSLGRDPIPGKDMIDIDALVFSSYKKRDLEFEWAQSARRLEGVVTSGFTGLDDGDKMNYQSYTANQAFLEDKVNHNRLNAFEQNETGLRLRNTDSTIAPVFYEDNHKTSPSSYFLNYVYHLKFSDRTSAHDSDNESLQQQMIEQFGSAKPDVRDLYCQVYTAIGRGRDVKVNLEHTYGSQMELVEFEKVPNPLDEPIVLASDIEHTQPNDNTNTDSMPFWQVDFKPAEQQSPAKLELTINTRFLTEDWVNEVDDKEVKQKRRRTNISCWQAIAELAHSRGSTITLECYDFKVREAIKSKDFSIAGGLISTLKTVDINDVYTRDVDDLSLLCWCKKLLSAVITADGSMMPFVVYEGALGVNFYALRALLTVNRKTQKVVAFNDGYEIHEKLERVPKRDFNKPPGADNPFDVDKLFNKNGCVTVINKDPEVRKQVAEHSQRLQSLAGYITPAVVARGVQSSAQLVARQSQSLDPQSRFRNVSAMLGSGHSPGNAAATNNAWLVLPNKVEKPGELEVTYCPIGIKPIVSNPLVGEFTSALMRKYYSGLQHIIDFNCHQWFYSKTTSENTDAPALKLLNKVKSLSRDSATDFEERYSAAINVALAKLWALPDTSLPGSVLNPRIKELAGEINQRLTQQQSDFYSYLQRLFMNEPSLFDKLKALAVVQVQGKDGGVLPEDFHNLVISRSIERNSTPLLSSLDLPSAFKFNNDTIWYLELLDDDTYDNEFEFRHIIGETVERAIEQQSIGTAGYDIAMANGQINLPQKAPVAIDSAIVRFASRRPVVAPLPCNSKHLLGANMHTWFKVDDSNQDRDENKKCLFDLNQFLRATPAWLRENGAGTPANEFGQPLYVADTEDYQFDNFDDTAILSAVFTIRGDEESGSQNPDGTPDPLRGIGNDAFYILLEDVETESGISQKQPDVGSDFRKALDVLRSKKPLAATALDDLLTEKAWNTCKSLVEATPPENKVPIKNVVRACQIDSDNDRNNVRLLPHGGIQQSKNAGLWLFRGKDADTLYLWVEVAIPVWQPKNIKLVQTRNELNIRDDEHNQDSLFSPVFASISKPAFSKPEMQPLFNGYSDVFNGVPMAKQTYTVREFIQKALVGRLENVDENFLGRFNRLTITLKEDSSAYFPVAGGGNRGVYNGSFGQNTVQVQPDSAITWGGATIDFLNNSDINRWRVDFEWRHPELNTVILRIEDVPIVTG